MVTPIPGTTRASLNPRSTWRAFPSANGHRGVQEREGQLEKIGIRRASRSWKKQILSARHRPEPSPSI